MTFKKYIVMSNASITDVLKKFKKHGRKTLIVSDKALIIKGVISDGDIRNYLLKEKNLSNSIKSIYNKKPILLDEKKSKNIKIVKSIFIESRIDILPTISKKKIVGCLLWEDIFEKDKNVNNYLLKDLDFIIMAGGQGTRLKPFTDILPKPLIPIDGIPIITHIINNCNNYNFNKIYISINNNANILKSYLQHSCTNTKLDYITEKNPLGTIGALGLVRQKLQKNFFVCNCDMLFNINYKLMYDYHVKNKNDITLTTSFKKYSIPYGVCKTNRKNLLTKIDEKPSFNFLVNLGLYIFSKNITTLIRPNEPMDINQLISVALKKKYKIGVYSIDENSYSDVGQWSEYSKIIQK